MWKQRNDNGPFVFVEWNVFVCVALPMSGRLGERKPSSHGSFCLFVFYLQLSRVTDKPSPQQADKLVFFPVEIFHLCRTESLVCCITVNSAHLLCLFLCVAVCAPTSVLSEWVILSSGL